MLGITKISLHILLVSIKTKTLQSKYIKYGTFHCQLGNVQSNYIIHHTNSYIKGLLIFLA